MISLFPSRRVAIELLGWDIHWYGLLYVAAFLLAWFLLPRLAPLRKVDMTSDEWGSILGWAILGVLIGGRLGFVLFYEPAYFLSSPLQIVAVWKGGMSSHGGFLGVLIALLLRLRHLRVSEILAIADIFAVPAALGLMLGRIGNFINGELYGPVTSVAWAMSFPGVEGLRHPTQLYAAAKDLLIAMLCFLHLVSVRRTYPGRTFSLFLVLYGALRFLVEEFRVQEYSEISLGMITLTRGQVLTVPIVIAGIVVFVIARRMAKKIEQGF